MKYVAAIILIFLIASCSGSKAVVANTEKSQPDPEIIDIQPKDSTDTPITIIEKSSIPESEIFQEEAPDTIKETVYTHAIWNDLLNQYVSEAGTVDYRGFKKNWNALKTYFKELDHNFPNSESSKEEKLVYWINAYNAFTIDLILQNYPLKSIKDIKDPWKQRLWKLGNKWYNLDEIEHQILRKMNEPRIHFAIVCASYSCPKLQNEAFEASTIEDQLTKTTHQFLSDPERNSITTNRLELSKIFQWFSKDFKQNGSLIDFLNRFSDIEISPDAKILYKKYNWDLNE